MVGRCRGSAHLTHFTNADQGDDLVGTDARAGVVGSGELVDKPVALINASPRATHAHAALMDTLTVMSAQIVPGASITVPLQGRGLDANGIAADPVLSAALGAAVDTLASAARSHPRETV